MPIRLHWILSVIDPYNNTVYYLDSLCEDGTTGTKRDIISDLQDIVNTALFQFQSDREITTKLKMNTKWLKIKYFSDCQFPKYDQEQIDEVRIHWVRYVLQQI
ncbi:uncharacterized protein LOC110728698 isoform X2 [Chenopodium quinoa]|nr:uncharacterized protein LOC110728698 isoform X2 [Chenopodium quinoa]